MSDTLRADLDALAAAHAKQLEHLQAELARRDVVVAEMRSALGRWADATSGLTEATPAELDARIDELRKERGAAERVLEELLAQVRVQSPVTGWSDTLANVMRRRYAREAEQWKANHDQRKAERDAARAEVERMRAALDEACDRGLRLADAECSSDDEDAFRRLQGALAAEAKE